MDTRPAHGLATVAGLPLSEIARKDEYFRGLFEGLKDLVQRTNLVRLVAQPNFRFGWLEGPTGYVANLHSDRTFAADLFFGEGPRVIVAAEVKLKGAWTDAHSKHMETVCRRCIPLEPAVAPTLQDREGSGWSPSLGRRGGSLGYYSTKEKAANGDVWQRVYLVAHTGLPDATIHRWHEHNEAVHRANLEREGYFAQLEEGLPQPLQAAPAGGGAQSPKVVTYGEEFAEGGVQQRLQGVAVENAKRLILLLSALMEIELYAPVYQCTRSADGVEEVHDASQLYAEGAPYRVPEGETAARAANVEKLIEALRYWPPGAPIQPCTRLSQEPKRPGMTKDARQAAPPDDLRGFPLGAAVVLYKNAHTTTKEAWEQFADVHCVTLEEHPHTFPPCLVTQYNTFRRDVDGNVIWLAGCSPTTDAENGVAVVCPPQQGFRVVRPSFLRPRHAPNAASAPPKVSSQWGNVAGQAYPVAFPFVPQATKGTLPAARETFFCCAHGGLSEKADDQSVATAQLRGAYDMRAPLMHDSSVVRDLGADLWSADTVELEPLHVYMSPEPATAARYELV